MEDKYFVQMEVDKIKKDKSNDNVEKDICRAHELDVSGGEHDDEVMSIYQKLLSELIVEEKYKNNKRDLPRVYANFASFLKERNEIRAAIIFYKLADELYKKYKELGLNKHSQFDRELYECYYKIGDMENASLHKKRYLERNPMVEERIQKFEEELAELN